MELDADGHIRLVDRKKEIYKNVKGETIAPQRIESLFRDFRLGRPRVPGRRPPRVQHRAHLAQSGGARTRLRRDVRRRMQGALPLDRASVNAFLAPFERIVDFALMDRDLSAEHGELTPKGRRGARSWRPHFAERFACSTGARS
jgi:long-subunit acyl-CoA synthetase (AMP-forming)